MYTCGMKKATDCYEKCCFICPCVESCPDECGLSDLGDDCSYIEEELCRCGCNNNMLECEYAEED